MPDAAIYWGMDFGRMILGVSIFIVLPFWAAAKVKHVAERADIARIWNAVRNCIVDKEYQALSGGVYYMDFVKQDGAHVVLATGASYVKYMSQYYVLKTPLRADELWESLGVDEVAVSQETLSALCSPQG